MVTIEKSPNGFNVTGSVVATDSLYNLIENLCSQTPEIEYIGNQVNKESRERFVLVEYDSKLYSFSTFFNFADGYTLQFVDFASKIDETEPLENYRYCIDCCSNEVPAKPTRHWYYKAHELSFAEVRLMELELAKNSAVLHELK